MKRYFIALVFLLFLVAVCLAMAGCAQTCPVQSAEQPQDFRTWSTNTGEIGVSGCVSTPVRK